MLHSCWSKLCVRTQLAAALPDAELSRGVEEGARARAVQLYAKAVDAYNQVYILHVYIL